MEFVLAGLAYPASLYLIPKCNRNTEEIKCKLVVTVGISFALAIWLRASFNFDYNLRLLFLTLTSLLPFGMPIMKLPASSVDLEFWRDFVIAPTIEEFYFRILMPQLGSSSLALSAMFSLAHAHVLLQPKRWPDKFDVAAQCGISFAFGLVANLIRSKALLPANNVWLWMALSLIHGVANFVGIPHIDGNHFQTGLLILSIAVLLIV